MSEKSFYALDAPYGTQGDGVGLCAISIHVFSNENMRQAWIKQGGLTQTITDKKMHNPHPRRFALTDEEFEIWKARLSEARMEQNCVIKHSVWT